MIKQLLRSQETVKRCSKIFSFLNKKYNFVSCKMILFRLNESCLVKKNVLEDLWLKLIVAFLRIVKIWNTCSHFMQKIIALYVKLKSIKVSLNWCWLKTILCSEGIFLFFTKRSRIYSIVRLSGESNQGTVFPKTIIWQVLDHSLLTIMTITICLCCFNF